VLNAHAAHLGDAFLLVLRLAMPFLIYAVIVNLAIGLANKMSPQIPVYFISMPFVVGGGLVVFAMLGPDMVSLFSDAASDAVRSGAGWR
jgi:flagellar biosynthetic protein FliR